VFVFLPSLPLTATPNINLEWVYINNNLVWESPPSELHKTYQYADNTHIVVLYPSGEFAQVSGTLLRDKETGHLSLCEGCGFSIFKGVWHLENSGKLNVRKKLVYGQLRPAKDSEEVNESWKMDGESKVRLALRLHSPTTTYKPLKHLENLGLLSQLITFEGQPSK
jgi:hypothetical protein